MPGEATVLGQCHGNKLILRNAAIALGVDMRRFPQIGTEEDETVWADSKHRWHCSDSSPERALQSGYQIRFEWPNETSRGLMPPAGMPAVLLRRKHVMTQPAQFRDHGQG